MSFSRFLMVHPVAPMDKELLVRMIGYFTTLLNLRMRPVTENLLSQINTALTEKNSVLLSLLLDLTYAETDANFKRYSIIVLFFLVKVKFLRAFM